MWRGREVIHKLLRVYRSDVTCICSLWFVCLDDADKMHPGAEEREGEREKGCRCRREEEREERAREKETERESERERETEKETKRDRRGRLEVQWSDRQKGRALHFLLLHSLFQSCCLTLPHISCLRLVA